MILDKDITWVSIVVCVALEGFSYVPQLHPLETLHNTLTYREVDDFLGRITTTRFPMPAISPTIVANRPSLMLVSPNKCELKHTCTCIHTHTHTLTELTLSQFDSWSQISM